MSDALFLYAPERPLLFSSGTFLVLFVMFILGYSVLAPLSPSRGAALSLARRALNPRLLKLGYLYLFSLFFYYKSSGWFLGLLLFTTVLDFALARLIHRSQRLGIRRGALVVSLLASLGVLAYLKYANFLLANTEHLFGANIGRVDVVLPVGISFYTFQSVSYVVDVYRRRLAPTHSLLDYGLYLSFFPQIVAGPIVRAEQMFPQLEQLRAPNREDIREGLYRILIGLMKKCALADYIAAYTDVAFGDPAAMTGTEVVLATYAYALQIYFDFSGYSDLAIGLARILGIKLPENFDAPYRARSVQEFWQQWHITLSSWLRDYVYIPLGGNRRGARRTTVNLMLTMLLGGLWHGASWTFVIWGGLHGIGLAITKQARRMNLDLPPLLAWLLTFHFVVFAWTLFRCESFTHWWQLLSAASELRLVEVPKVLSARFDVVVAVLCGWLALMIPQLHQQRARHWFLRTTPLARTAIALVVVQSVIQLQSTEIRPFIYFQF